MWLKLSAIAVPLFLVANLSAQPLGSESGVTKQKHVQVSPRVRATLPRGFAAVPQRTRNLTEVVRRAAGAQTAYVAITYEPRSDHAQAIRRLLEIANEAEGKRTFTEICGWARA